MQKSLHLTAFMRPVSLHTGAWRYPGAWADANFNFSHLKSFAQALERAKFDALFMADHLAVLNMPVEALRRSHTVTSFEPFTLLSALAAVTDRIGLAATASTTFDEPYHVARRFASLDHISGGRAAWNIVTTSNPDAARNFGLSDHVEHGERYKRAREFFDVVTGLWDSFADDAFIRDQQSGIFFDPEKMHVLDHKGKHFSVRGPLNASRPPQGHPIIIQAGSSGPGQDLAARTAPELPLFTRVRDLIVLAFRAAGATTEMGTSLHRVFRDAGLPAPRSTLGGCLGRMSDPDVLAFVMGVWNALAPVVDRLGLDLGVEPADLPDLLCAEAAAADAVVLLPPLVSAWTQVPAAAP